ncbi:MAG: serine/threonine-protein kinase, partial [Myxococcota bacterium]
MLFGKYRLIRKLATGGMAEIFLARQEGMEGFRKDVVIKRILPIHADNDELIEMFIDEARIAASLNHPNIVQIYELGKFEDDHFIAMEYVHGQDLRRTAERGLAVGNYIPLRHAVRGIADAAAGLHYAHTQVDDSGDALNIVHRDISPQNILVSFDGVLKILDFGIAKAENKIVDNRTGQLKGKYAYMSPEQCNGLDVDARSDIFSLGIVLYEITLCRRLFKGDTDIQTIKRVSDAEVTPPTEIQPEFPKRLEEIILKALAKEPDDRYPSARELQMDLEDFLSDNRIKPHATDGGREDPLPRFIILVVVPQLDAQHVIAAHDLEEWGRTRRAVVDVDDGIARNGLHTNISKPLTGLQ